MMTPQHALPSLASQANLPTRFLGVLAPQQGFADLFPVLWRDNRTAFSGLVKHVVFLRSEKQVRWPHAKSVIALVEDA